MAPRPRTNRLSRNSDLIKFIPSSIADSMSSTLSEPRVPSNELPEDRHAVPVNPPPQASGVSVPIRSTGVALTDAAELEFGEDFEDGDGVAVEVLKG